MKVLALTVAAGAGHVRAAEALRDGFQKYKTEVEVVVVDTLKYINPMIDKVVVGSYLRTLKTTPSLYARLYKFADKDEIISGFSEMINDVLSLKLKGLVEDVKPDVIICTHPFPIEMLSILKKKGKINIPVAAVLTDYAVHSFWIYSHIESYIIPNEDFIDEVVKKGIPREKVFPLGIPVNEEFTLPLKRDEAKQSLGLNPDTLTLLMMGGGLGIGNIRNMFEPLALGDMDIQIICVAGKNPKLRDRLTDISKKSNKNILIYEYTKDISRLMSASDILVSKPGGLTIAESLIKGLPILITSAIPGQEEENATYLQNNGIAARVKKKGNITRVLSQLSSSKLRLRHMREMALEKAKPNAVKDICELLIQMAGKNSN